MGKKVIRCNLNSSSIDDAIRELEAYKVEFLKKVDKYRQRVAAEIAGSASFNFGSALMEDKLRGGMRKPNVKVNVDERGSISVVVANGEDAVWCEFGAGVYHNPSEPYPNPRPDGIVGIGEYGEGKGKRKAWGYMDENGDLVITRGNPAVMPMWYASEEIKNSILKIAKEVWG